MPNLLLNRPSRDRIQKAIAMLAFTLCLAATAHSAFAQSADPPTVVPPSPTEPVHDIIPVHLDAASGDITVGRTTYHGANPGLHLLALDPQPDTSSAGSLDTPVLIRDQVVNDPGSAIQFMQGLLSNKATSDAILIANGGDGNYNVAVSAIAKNLEQFGGQVDLELLPGPLQLIFIGSGGRNKGGALQRGGSNLPYDGYLVPNQNGKLTFIQTDFVRYDIGVDGTIKVGNTTYDVASSYKPGCGGVASNSFHLLILSRESLQPTIVNNTYCTAQSDIEILRLTNDLAAHATTEDVLVFLASNGHPIPQNWDFNTGGDLRIFQLARKVASLGGYYETVADLSPNDTYSFVGAVAPPSFVARARDRAAEASSVYPPTNGGLTTPTGELHGVLARGRGNWYSPRSSDTTGLANLQLNTILAMPPSAFPTYNGDQLAAFKTINNKLCSSDNCLRNAYSNLGVDIVSGYQISLAGLVDPVSQGNCDLNANAGLPFCTVRKQLLDELKLVSQVRQLYSNVDSLWAKNNSTSINSALSAYNDVKATLPAPATAQSSSLVRPLVNFFLGLAGNIPVVGQAFGIADTAFNLGEDLTTDSQGNKMVDLTSTIGQLQEQAVENFIQQETTTGTMFQLILEDYDMISVLGNAVLTQTDKNSPWYWPPSLSGQLLGQMQIAVKQAAYQNVMAAVYAIGSYYPQTPLNCFGNGPNPIWGQKKLFQQPRAYVVSDFSYNCGAGGGNGVTPFQPTDLPWYIPYTFPNDPDNPFANNPSTGTIMADNSWLAISLQSSQYDSGPQAHYDAPNSTFMANLFTPQPNGLGVYRAAFFEGWPFPRVTCDPSSGVYPPGQPGASNGGCNWNSAKPPLQSSPGPAAAGLTIHAYQTATNQTQVQVLLIISNSGTLLANSVQFSSIKLHTLGGSGEATIVSPAIPVAVNDVAAGDSINLVLTLNIPPGITKLGITEEGSMNVGEPDLSNFSAGQVLYIQK